MGPPDAEKENVQRVQTFETEEELRHALIALLETCNGYQLIQRHRLPAQFKRD